MLWGILTGQEAKLAFGLHSNHCFEVDEGVTELDARALMKEAGATMVMQPVDEDPVVEA